MFRGVAQLSMDGKGRLAIPTKYREALLAHGDGKLVITADPSKCLLLYPLPDWEPIYRQLMALPSFDPNVRGVQRLIGGYADDVEMDAQGRILVSPSLREFASLSRAVTLVGQGAKFELWDALRWGEQRERASVPGGGMPPGLEGFSL
ncbi:MAG: division/cell wall cluster transcriptional repressor MraZ [Proteobacteria bacterium]|nr:division/cell wall cluster transcriptional repressor MraZ [Burkholderiales bacterium]